MKSNNLRRISQIVVAVFAISIILGGMALADTESRVDINKATVNELAKLPGIGKKKAEAIIAYRTEHGKFNSVDDLKKVDGIGEKTFKEIKERITAEGNQ